MIVTPWMFAVAAAASMTFGLAAIAVPVARKLATGRWTLVLLWLLLGGCAWCVLGWCFLYLSTVSPSRCTTVGDRWRVTFLDVKTSSEPLRPGETPESRRAAGPRKVTVEGDAPGRAAALLAAWGWLKAVEAPRLVFPGEYVVYSDPVLVPPTQAPPGR